MTDVLVEKIRCLKLPTMVDGEFIELISREMGFSQSFILFYLFDLLRFFVLHLC